MFRTRNSLNFWELRSFKRDVALFLFLAPMERQTHEALISLKTKD
jgi:hypothetical protein